MLFNRQSITASQHARITALMDALNSTKYTQANGVLHRHGGGYCCLGVACDLYRLQTGRGHWSLPTEHATEHSCISFVLTDDMGKGVSTLTTQLNHTLSDWFGFNSEVQSILVGLNDRRTPFPAIAFFLQRWLLKQSLVHDPSPTPLPA
jgi:hypothetical protein